MDDLQLKHYKVEITEISQKTVSVGALSVEDALRRARQDYKNGYIVLDADDHISTSYDAGTAAARKNPYTAYPRTLGG